MRRFWHTHPVTNATLPDFATRLVAWQRKHGRHDLPWQVDDPYAIWVSEIMLQQTQVETVIPYYARFMARFPDLATLAAADEDQVMRLWAGLGYYSRARNLHAAARRICTDFAGTFPMAIEAIASLPGIGRSTAAAIAAFAFGQRRTILDGNVKRVLSRIFGIDGWPGDKAVEQRLWKLAESLLPDNAIRAYTQGLMDLGATVCTRSRPRCIDCPYTDDCVANRDGRHAELPASRPKKGLPEKSTGMLVLLHAGEVLLEKRPAPGIWGGLWSLPECALDEDPAHACQRLGLVANEVQPLPGFSHAFTHFRLHIRPWRVAATPAAGASEPGRLWLALGDIEDAALPTPVRRLLRRLADE